MKKNPLESARHIVVEGPIGVGKTSLARRLADHLQSELLLEQPQATGLAHQHELLRSAATVAPRFWHSPGNRILHRC